VARAKRRSGFWIAQKFESRGVTGGAVAGHPEKLVTAGPIKGPRLSSSSLAPVCSRSPEACASRFPPRPFPPHPALRCPGGRCNKRERERERALTAQTLERLP
jgi:hypothetical protein